MKHSIKEIKEKNQTTVTVTQRGGGGGGGGVLTEVLYEEALPQGPKKTFRPKSNLEGFVWSHQSITGLISQRQFAPQC